MSVGVGLVVHYGFPYYARAHLTTCTYFIRAYYKNSERFPVPTGFPIRPCRDCQPSLETLLRAADQIVWGDVPGSWQNSSWNGTGDALDKAETRITGDMVDNILGRKDAGF